MLELFAKVEVVELTLLETTLAVEVALVVELTMLVAEVVALSLEDVARASPSSYLKSFRSLLPPELVLFVVLFDAV